MDEAHQGRDMVILEMVMEAAGLLTHGQLESSGVATIQAAVPPLVADLSQPPMAEAV